LKQIEALREREHQQHQQQQHQQQQQQQRSSVDSAPKKFFETDHTNASANSSGDGSGWTEVSVAPQIMEMKQAGGVSRIAARFCNTCSAGRPRGQEHQALPPKSRHRCVTCDADGAGGSGPGVTQMG